jgi:predicted hydrocarbon binding protein
MCSFAEGLLQGAAEHYGERLSIAQPLCMKRGDEQCLLEIAFL